MDYLPNNNRGSTNTLQVDHQNADLLRTTSEEKNKQDSTFKESAISMKGEIPKEQIQRKVGIAAANTDSPIIIEKAPRKAIFSSSFVHGIANKIGTPLPPFPTLPWMSHVKPLPPFESLMPPGMKTASSMEAMSDTTIMSKIKFPLKANKPSAVIPTDGNSFTQLKKTPLHSMPSLKMKILPHDDGKQLIKNKIPFKLSIGESDASMSSSTSLSSDSSTSEDEKCPDFKGSHKLINKKMIPKYGEPKPDTPINYEAMREALPKNKFRTHDKSEEGYENIYYDQHIHDTYSEKPHPKHISLDSNDELDLSHVIDIYGDAEFVDTELLKSKKYNKYCRKVETSHSRHRTSKIDKQYSKSSVRKSSMSYHHNWDDAEKYHSSSKRNKERYKSDDGCSYKSLQHKNTRKKAPSRNHHKVKCTEKKGSKRLKSGSSLKHKRYAKSRSPKENYSGSDRESGECSSTGSESDSEALVDFDKADVMSPQEEHEPAEWRTDMEDSISKDLYAGREDKSPEDSISKDLYAGREGKSPEDISIHYVQLHSTRMDSDCNRSSLPKSIVSPGNTTPLPKSLCLLNEEIISNHSNSNLENEETRVRKGPHTPDYPYEKSPTDVSDRESISSHLDSDKSITVTQYNSIHREEYENSNRTTSRQATATTVTKSNNSIKGSICNYTINHYKPTYSTDKSKVTVETFSLNRQEIIPKSTADSNLSSNAVKSCDQKNVKESPIRSNLDARINSMFGLRNSSSEESPVKMDSSQKQKIYKPLRETPSPFRSRNTYLHWYKETYLFKKALDTHAYPYIDPNKRIKIGIQIKKYSEDFSSDEEEPSESYYSLQDLGISPPRFNRVRQILDFDRDANIGQSNILPKSSELTGNKVVKMTISPDTELELNFAPDAANGEELCSTNSGDSSHLLNLIVSKLLSDLKTSLKREITDDVIDNALINETGNKKMKRE